MRPIDLGALLLCVGVGLAVGFDSVALTNLGSFIAGVGLGFLAKAVK